jgi:Sec-independent protein translocase protein TatA
LFFGANRLPQFGGSFGMKDLREEAARLGDEDETQQQPRDNEDKEKIGPNAGKGERSV